MRHFTAILCCCFVAFVNADKLGYNHQLVAHSPCSAASNFAPTYTFEPHHAGDSYNYDFAQPSAVEPSYQPSYQPSAEQSADAPNYAAAQPELQKEFFTFTANEEEFDDPSASEKVSNSLNKALRVVFVKGPDHSALENAALALAKQAAQEETALYVLNKQADIGDLANKLNSIPGKNNNKPEVHFVKYRTPEDAANAQHAIQGQYDQLGGTSSQQDGGVAPSLNFASSAPAPVAAVSPAASAPAQHFAELQATVPVSSYIPPVTPGSTYLPANILRL